MSQDRLQAVRQMKLDESIGKTISENLSQPDFIFIIWIGAHK